MMPIATLLFTIQSSAQTKNTSINKRDHSQKKELTSTYYTYTPSSVHTTVIIKLRPRTLLSKRVAAQLVKDKTRPVSLITLLRTKVEKQPKKKTSNAKVPSSTRKNRPLAPAKKWVTSGRYAKDNNVFSSDPVEEPKQAKPGLLSQRTYY